MVFLSTVKSWLCVSNFRDNQILFRHSGNLKLSKLKIVKILKNPKNY